MCNHSVNRLQGVSTGKWELHEVSVDKIVDNTEEPLKPRNSMQAGQSFWTRHSVGKSTDIVNMNRTVCVDKIVDNTEQPLNQDSQSKQGSLSKQDIQWGNQLIS